MAGARRNRSRFRHIIFTRYILTRITIFLLIVTGTLSLPKPLDRGTPLVHPHNKKTGTVDPNDFVWDQIFKFIMKSQGTHEPDFFKESKDSFEDYKYQPVPKALANDLEDKTHDDYDKTVNTMDGWSFSKGNNRTVLASDSMQLAKIINDTLITKWNSTSTVTESWWSVCQLPIIVTVSGVLGVILVALIVVLWFKRQMRKGDKDLNFDEVSDSFEENPPEDHAMSANSPTNPGNDPEEHEPAPSPPPDIELNDYAGVVTQEVEPVREQEKVTELMTQSGKEKEEEKPEGVKFKGRGLLERRGSFASLNIGLPQGAFDNRFGLISPPEECDDEYLLTTSKVLSRSQLGAALKDTQALHAEFWDIPLNHPERIEVAMSGTKNRYETIMPNDRTRVKLDIVSPNPLDSYINANYIRGFNGEEKAYIATQGPLHNTITDFYHMVWKERSPAIIMITELCDKGKKKCETYFPLMEAQTVKFGDYEATTLSVTLKDGYTVREMAIQKNNECRLVLHYWLDTWPDHTIPDNANTILTLASEVESFRLAVKNSAYPFDAQKYSIGFAPIVVHCSAGIGRTGCFIGITIGMNQLKRNNEVDVLGIVCQMRYDRGGMVQTAEQYEFLHQALCEYAETLPGSSTN